MAPDDNDEVRPGARTLSHDLKTPLTGIRMILQLLIEEKVGSLNEQQRKMIRQANDDCERMVRVIQQRLDT
jgi:signal transduction histidine kinase